MNIWQITTLILSRLILGLRPANDVSYWLGASLESVVHYCKDMANTKRFILFICSTTAILSHCSVYLEFLNTLPRFHSNIYMNIGVFVMHVYMNYTFNVNGSCFHKACRLAITHDDVIKWKHFARLLGICAGNSPVPGEFPAQRPVTRSFDVFFDLRLNKRLSKQSWGWWFETLSCSLWRHCDDLVTPLKLIWRSGTCRFNLRVRDIAVTLTWH